MSYTPFLAVLWMACATTSPQTSVNAATSDGDPVECLTRELRQADYVITSAARDPGVVIAERRSQAGRPAANTEAMWVLTFRVLDDGVIEASVEEGRGMADRPATVQSMTRRSEEDRARALAERCSRSTR